MKKIFKIIFTDEKHESLELYANNVANSDILGFVEAEELVFINSSELIVSPDDDKIKKMFRNSTKVMLPIGSIIRIEEVSLPGGAPIVRIYGNSNEN